jgi:sporulation related protein
MKKIILILFIVLFAIQLINAQGLVNKNLFTLYENQDFEELKSEIDKLDDMHRNSAEIEFLNSVFLENGEDALKIYLKLFDNSYGDLKSIVSKKLSDYYYAKGYYLTASKYQKYLVESTDTKPPKQKNVTIKTEQKKYIIQLGAFGLKENAVQLLKMLQTQNLYSRIENRNINGKSLHCVWLDGKKGFSETLEFAEKIKEKYHLQYRILQQ